MNRNPHQGNLVWQLLKCNISRSQLTAYTLSNFIGLSIVLTAIQFYLEVSDTLESDDSFISRDYVVVSPKVSGLGSLSGGEPAMFDSTDIAGIASEPWAWRVGVFTSARFNVDASLDMNGRGMSTSLFFESVPDEFFDTVPPEGTCDPSNPEIPIVISKDYLTLYNFGFASTHGLPQLSEGMTGILPLRVSISGRGRQMWIPARIAGFSSRLNTIAVPEKFMTWANDNFDHGLLPVSADSHSDSHRSNNQPSGVLHPHAQHPPPATEKPRPAPRPDAVGLQAVASVRNLLQADSGNQHRSIYRCRGGHAYKPWNLARSIGENRSNRHQSMGKHCRRTGHNGIHHCMQFRLDQETHLKLLLLKREKTIDGRSYLSRAPYSEFRVFS